MAPIRRSTRTVSSTATRDSSQPYTRTNTNGRSSATVDRAAEGANKPRLNLKVSAPPSKLRQATSANADSSNIPPNPYTGSPSESDATPQPAARPARRTRNPRVVLDPDSEDGEDEDAEGEDVDEEMGEGLDDELLGNEDSEEDAEGEEEEEDDDEMDELADDHPPPPVIKQMGSKGKPQVQVTAPNEGPLKSVEDKEMDDDDDDEELSELEEDEQNEIENEGGEDEEDEELDSDDEDDMSRSATPDMSKLTKRQRGHYVEPDAGLMALSNEAQKKKHLTAEEHAMRRAEMARRRKNLSEKRNEEEKMDTINKLLKKPAPKRRTRAEIIAAQQAETPELDDGERADSLYTRYISRADGRRVVAVPDEWLEGPVGAIFAGAAKRIDGGGSMGMGRMVEEVV